MITTQNRKSCPSLWQWRYRKLAGQGGFQLAKVFQASAETFLPWCRHWGSLRKLMLQLKVLPREWLTPSLLAWCFYWMQFYLISTPLARCSKKITHATPSSDLHLKAPNSEFLKYSPPLSLFLNCKQPFSLVGTYACLELELKDDGQVEAFLKNLVVNYMTALERNLDIRSQEAAPILEAFSIFDPSCLPKPEDPVFKKYAVDEVKMLCKQFQFDKDHTLAQWYNFKYLMSSWKLPSAVLREKDDHSPTEFILRKVV